MLEFNTIVDNLASGELAASGATHGAPASDSIIVLNARVGSSAPNEPERITRFWNAG